MVTIVIGGEDYSKESKISFEKIEVTCDLTIERIAKAIADKPSDAQAIFFNEFAKWVNIFCKEKAGIKGEFQFMYIADELKSESIEMMEAMLYKINADKEEQDE